MLLHFDKMFRIGRKRPKGVKSPKGQAAGRDPFCQKRQPLKSRLRSNDDDDDITGQSLMKGLNLFTAQIPGTCTQICFKARGLNNQTHQQHQLRQTHRK